MNIENKEAKEHYASVRRLVSANYRVADDPTKRCNVCDSGKQVLGTGIRLCRTNIAFVTCGGTCDSFDKKNHISTGVRGVDFGKLKFDLSLTPAEILGGQKINCPRCNIPVFVRLPKEEWKNPKYPIYECQSCSYFEERFE